MLNIMLAIAVGVLSSIAASLMFLLFLTRLKPRLQISEQIAKGKSSKGATIFRIKVINKTPRAIMHIRAYFHIVTPTVVPGGTIEKAKQIPLVTGEILELPKFDKKDREANYAYRFITYKNIEDIWDDACSYLRFRICATDSLSGFSKVFARDYYTKRNVIKEGDFQAGESLKVV